jgi:hypothetical protein
VLEFFSGFGFISRMQTLVRPMSTLAMDILSKHQMQQVRFSENNREIESAFAENYRTVDLFLPERISESLIAEIGFSAANSANKPAARRSSTGNVAEISETALKNFNGPIIYSSCDAATMARDLALFAAEGYSCVTMRAFDFFPWTHHYETVSYLVKSPDSTTSARVKRSKRTVARRSCVDASLL